MKRYLCALMIVVLLTLTLSGCQMRYPDMQDDAVAFRGGEYIDTNDDEAGYLTIDYQGRTYLPYGTLAGSLQSSDLDRCVGYIIQDEHSSSNPDPADKTVRIYTLTQDPECDFLMEHYIGTTLMNPPSFFRAIDTRGKNIDTPPYIESLGYSFWYES